MPLVRSYGGSQQTFDGLIAFEMEIFLTFQTQKFSRKWLRPRQFDAKSREEHDRVGHRRRTTVACKSKYLKY